MQVDGTIPLPIRDLHDLSRVERLEVGSVDFRRIAEVSSRAAERVRDARLAIIAPQDHVYGMFRMFEMLTEHAKAIEELRRQGLAPSVRVFRQHDEARQWLLAANRELEAQ